jgi:hypothetical protein
MKKDSIKKLEQTWFNYKSQRVKSYSKDDSIFYPFPALVFIIHILFLCGVVSFVLLKGNSKTNGFFVSALLLVTGVWIANFGFSVLTSPIVLRYQLFPLLLFFSFSVLLIECIYKTAWVA